MAALYTPFAHAHGTLVFVSGQTPLRDGAVTGPGMAEQAAVALHNLEAVLGTAGARLADVVRVGVFLDDLEDLPAFNSAYEAVFGATPPARTLVGANLPGYRVEIDCVAVLPTGS
jgi:2-iminobutanoate/2-iminopropanoate deaminase